MGENLLLFTVSYHRPVEYDPAERKRSRLALSLGEREEISRGIVSQLSIRTIARQLGRSPSTISREIHRNGGYHAYRASQADQQAWERSKRPKPCKLACYPALSRIIANKLKLFWSPEQIAGWLKRTYPEDESYQVSHETIYRSLFIQARGVLKKELQQSPAIKTQHPPFQASQFER